MEEGDRWFEVSLCGHEDREREGGREEGRERGREGGREGREGRKGSLNLTQNISAVRGWDDWCGKEVVSLLF